MLLLQDRSQSLILPVPPAPTLSSCSYTQVRFPPGAERAPRHLQGGSWKLPGNFPASPSARWGQSGGRGQAGAVSGLGGPARKSPGLNVIHQASVAASSACGVHVPACCPQPGSGLRFPGSWVALLPWNTGASVGLQSHTKWAGHAHAFRGHDPRTS